MLNRTETRIAALAVAALNKPVAMTYVTSVTFWKRGEETGGGGLDLDPGGDTVWFTHVGLAAVGSASVAAHFGRLHRLSQRDGVRLVLFVHVLAVVVLRLAVLHHQRENDVKACFTLTGSTVLLFLFIIEMCVDKNVVCLQQMNLCCLM